MNVLPFILVMLTMMSIMTYARIQSFMQRSLVLSEFECYMQHIEHYYFNDVQENLFITAIKKTEPKDQKETEVNEKAKPPDGKVKKPTTVVEAEKYINLVFLYDKSERENHQEWFTSALLITKNLIHQLYQDKFFYQEIEEQNPGFIDQLLRTIMEKAEQQTQLKIKNPKDLANLNLENQELQEILAKMLRGSENTIEVLKACQKIQDDKLVIMLERQGFPSLATYTIASKKLKPIRLYLAPAPILKAIFNNDQDVEEIIKYRHRLYLDVRKEKPNDQASAEFKRAFQNKIPPQYDPSFFDFSVTQTKI